MSSPHIPVRHEGGAPPVPAGNERGEKQAQRQESIERNLLALAKTPEERIVAYQMASKARQIAMLRETANAVAGSTWGKELSPEARMGISRYALEIGVDAIRHIDILGNKIYLNAECYIDYCLSQPDFITFEFDYINHDERASAEENERRKQLRVHWNTPEDPKGICIITVKRNGRPDVQGCNWAGNRKGFNAKTGGSEIKDPVGEQDPGKTSFTRAFRRAVKVAYPLWFAKHPVAGESEEGGVSLDAISHLIEQGKEALKLGGGEKAAPLTEVAPGVKVAPGSGGGVPTQDGYPAQPEAPAAPAAPAPAAQSATEAPTAEEQALANGVEQEKNQLKEQIREVLKRECFGEDDRRVQERMMAKETVSLDQLRRWLTTYKERVAEWDAGRGE